MTEQIAELLQQQKNKREPDFYKKETGLNFQKKISININNDLILNIDVFSESKLSNTGYLTEAKIKTALEQVLSKFHEQFGLIKNNMPLKYEEGTNQANFRLFVFQKNDNYIQCISKKGSHLSSGGIAEASDNNYICNMYVNLAQDISTAKVDTIQHEFAHALTFYSTAKMDLGPVFMEGIAEYICKLLKEEKKTAKEKKRMDDPDFFKSLNINTDNLTLTDILNPEFSGKNKPNPYKEGAILIAYLQEKYPSFIKTLFYKATQDRKSLVGRHYFNKMMQNLHKEESKREENNQGLSDWLKSKLKESNTSQNETPYEIQNSVQMTAQIMTTPHFSNEKHLPVSNRVLSQKREYLTRFNPGQPNIT